MANDVLKFQCLDVSLAASAIVTQWDAMCTMKRNLEDVKNNLSNWQGAAHDEFIQAYEDVMPKVDALIKLIEQYKQQLNTEIQRMNNNTAEGVASMNQLASL